MNESITAPLIGLCIGIAIMLNTQGKTSHLLVFSDDLFFVYLLPPIIFNAGFQAVFPQFHDNHALWWCTRYSGIICHHVISTFLLTTYTSSAIGAMFSATDSVLHIAGAWSGRDTFAYSLVFGEGVVNDATSVVLFNAIQNFDLSHLSSGTALQLVGNFLYLFILSKLLGILCFRNKKLYFGRHSTDREVALMMLMAYLSYVLADLSAILTVFFCGIVISHYTWHNITESSRVTTKHDDVGILLLVAEIFIFLYIGMDALDIDKWGVVLRESPAISVELSSILLALVLIGRAAFVFPLSLLSNLTKKSPHEKVAFRQQVIIWWAGLMRGAVSMALAYNQFTRSETKVRKNAFIITSTITVVLFSTVERKDC
ncbi:hypothetical protein MLD38_010702 [Melastoma candidum]|uniref:Uncharacterized protein n=1 Tax=Melastoma candidum TaxID=119954 RepID=A0ACB9R0A4_9MYRT|nr:hypothetical protein MLD38_010702 [Melastoma candidum]